MPPTNYNQLDRKINKTIYQYCTENNLSKTEADLLSDYGAVTKDDCLRYFKIARQIPLFLKNSFNVDCDLGRQHKITKFILSNKKYYTNDAFLITKAVLDYSMLDSSLLKNAYPNDVMPFQRPAYDINKWSRTAQEIYNNLPKHSNLTEIMENQIKDWDAIEQKHFSNWLKYYTNNDHLRYNIMTKNAQFSPINNPLSGYTSNTSNVSAAPTDSKNEEKKTLKSKLRSRIKSIDELLYRYSDLFAANTFLELKTILRNLEDQILTAKMAATIEDCLNRGTSRLKKKGFIEGAEQLEKMAQEVAQIDPNTQLPPEPAQAPAPQQQLATAPAKQQVSQETANVSEAIGDVTRSSSVSIPDFNNVDIKEAVKKLEEINQVLSERSVIRGLAGVDIILGQLGVASFFPQLAEATSKLLDSYNYANTRISTVLGMMRGGQIGPQNSTTTQAPLTPKEDVVEVNEEEQPTEVVSPTPNTIPGTPPQQ